MFLGSNYINYVTTVLWFTTVTFDSLHSCDRRERLLAKVILFPGADRTATATWFPWHRSSEINARLNSGIRIAYKMGLTREFAWYSTINEKLRRKSNWSGRERKLAEVIKRKEHIIYGSHISKDTSVTMNNVTVSFFFPDRWTMVSNVPSTNKFQSRQSVRDANSEEANGSERDPEGQIIHLEMLICRYQCRCNPHNRNCYTVYPLLDHAMLKRTKYGVQLL